MQTNKTSAVLAALTLMLMGLAFMAPQAAAHDCEVELGDPNEDECREECSEGEAHDHRVGHHHENGIYDDYDHTHYECETQADEPTPPKEECDTPRIVGICVIDDTSSVQENIDELLEGGPADPNEVIGDLIPSDEILPSPCSNLAFQPSFDLEFGVDLVSLCNAVAA